MSSRARVLDPDTRDRLVSDLRWLSDDARQGRRIGSTDNAIVRSWLVDRFREIGLEASIQSFAPGRNLEAGNVIAAIPGQDGGDQAIVVTAHYDHLGTRGGTVYNGADDNASGTAALLAIAAWFVDQPPLHSLLLVALDGEEVGLLGARAFVEDPPVPLDRIVLNVNMDMIGRSDKGELFASGTRHYPTFRLPLEAVAESAPVTLRLGHDGPSGGREDWTGQSDHAEFHRAGIPFVYFGVEDHADYHRPTDDAELIETGFFVGSVETVISAIDTLDRHLSATRKMD